jgi:hypothetical protein
LNLFIVSFQYESNNQKNVISNVRAVNLQNLMNYILPCPGRVTARAAGPNLEPKMWKTHRQASSFASFRISEHWQPELLRPLGCQYLPGPGQ